MVSITNSIAQSAIRVANIQIRQINRHLDDMRYIAEDRARLALDNGSGSNSTSADLGSEALSDVYSFAETSSATQYFDVWGSPSVEFGAHNGSMNTTGYKYTQPGLTLGMDYQYSERLRLGISLGFNHSNSDLSSSSNTDSNAYLVSIYGSFSPTLHSFIEISVGYSYLQTDSSRLTNTGTAVGSTGANQFNGSVTGGYDFCFDALRISPYTMLLGSMTSTGGYAESGAGASDMAYGNNRAPSMILAGGIAVSYQFETEFGLITPKAKVEYDHDFFARPDNTSTTIGRLSASVPGVPTPSDYGLVELSSNLALNRGMSFELDFQATAWRRSDPYSVITLQLLKSF